MVRLFFLFFLLFSSVYCQELAVNRNFVSVKQGIGIRASSTFLHTNLEYYDSKQWSVSGDLNLGLTTQIPTIKTFASNSVHLNRHVWVKSVDVYAGIFTGLCLAEPYESITDDRYGIVPCYGIGVGMNYFSSTYFHFFMKGEYTFSQTTALDANIGNGFHAAFGLGYNISQIYLAYKKK